MQLSLRADEPVVKPAGAVSSKDAPAPTADLPAFSTDLDLPLVQESFTLGQPQTSGYVPPATSPSSRRLTRWPRWPQFDAEPALFAPDEDRPLKPLVGQFSDSPIWQADYVDTWGAHPATPLATPSPRVEWRRNGDAWPGFERVEVQDPSPTWGLRLDDVDRVVPVAAEEVVHEESSGLLPRLGKVGNRVCDEHECFADCTAPPVQPQHGEAAKVILELMETLGRSVLDGTVFQKPDQEQQEWLKELSADGQVSPREALIQYIRLLEAQQEQARSKETVCEEEEDCLLFCEHGPCRCPSECLSGGCPAACRAALTKTQTCAANCDCPDCPASCLGCGHCEGEGPCLCDGPASSIEVLREMAVHMEMAAAELERREIYNRADQIREVVAQLRQDARQTSLARASRKAPQVGVFRGVDSHGTPFFSCQQPPDIHAQLRELQEELRRTREELEQARQHRFHLSR
jgi:hypothetical protein